MVALGLLGACGGKGAEGPVEAQSTSEAPAPAAAKLDVNALLARETAGLSPQRLLGEQGAWSAEVLGSGAPRHQLQEGNVIVDIPIGAESNVRCQAFPETMDAGGTLHNVLAGAAEKVKFVAVEPTGVNVFARAPAASFEGQYLAKTSNGQAAGLLKIAFYAGHEASLLCMHDELGYRKTFASVAESFFKSYNRKGVTEPKPVWLEISKSSLNATDLSFNWTRVFPGEGKGELRYESTEASFIPASRQDLKIEDNASILDLDARGKLKRGVWVTAEGGELTLQMTLTNANNKLSYEGKVSGKELKGELSTAKGFATALDTAAMLKKQLKTGKPFKQVLYEYHPSLDPAALVPVTYTHAEGQEPRLVEMSLGQLKISVKVDASGMPESGSMPMAGRELRISRAYVEGGL